MFKKSNFKYFCFPVLLLLSVFLIFLFVTDSYHPVPKPERIYSTSSPKASIKMKKGRMEYFFRLMRDPKTEKIPENIRERELEYARTLPRIEQRLGKVSFAPVFNWSWAGPPDAGGRTRAIAVDLDNSNTIIAGGVSGGIWKSTDGGATWVPKNLPTQHLSVTSVAQDPRPDFRNIWYYSTGEYWTSARDRGARAWYYGVGVFKSTDNGETWFELPLGSGDSNQTAWSYPSDYIARVVVQPTTGYVFIASHGFGIFRSTDGGNNFSFVLGGSGDHRYCDVIAASNGTMIAALSQSNAGNSSPANSPGIYKSTNNGVTWIDITPSTFPSQHRRSVLASAPSAPDTLYVLTYTGNSLPNGNEDVRFHKIDVSNPSNSEDRSANLPDFGHSYEDFINTQRDYNMVVGVHPEDSRLVLIGATSLFRSRDGFATKPTNEADTWIGGYMNKSPWRYPHLHPDQHVFAFDPVNINKMWCGHDGGISVTNDITQVVTSGNYLSWNDKDTNYKTSQFYTVAIPYSAGDQRIMGGCQDIGTPYFTWNGTTASTSYDVSSGDGSYCYFGANFGYVSTQFGRVWRYGYVAGRPEYTAGWTEVTPSLPSGSPSQLFIHPIAIDPNDEDVLYYPVGNQLWRNDELSQIPLYKSGGITKGWTNLTSASGGAIGAPSEYDITTIAVSRNPAHVLYYGASGAYGTGNPPKIYRLNNANTATSGQQDISIPGITDEYYVHCIAINPLNADEIIVVMSNYNIIGLYHSSDGGATYTAVEGNLEGNATNPGPSIRSATIIPTDSEAGTIYVVGTSTGVYSTTQLNGPNTVWYLEGANLIGNTVVEFVTSRATDYQLVVGSHGRGIFVGKYNASPVEDVVTNPSNFYLSQNYPNPFNPVTTIEYSIPKSEHVLLRVFDATGREVARLVDRKESPGKYKVTFDGSNLPSGVYMYSIKAGRYSKTRKFTILK